jgi:hypothetical protein
MMMCVCPQFSFILFVSWGLMEALYKVNLNPTVAVFYPDNFFRKVDELVIKNSKGIALLFNDWMHSL